MKKNSRLTRLLTCLITMCCLVIVAPSTMGKDIQSKAPVHSKAAVEIWQKLGEKNDEKSYQTLIDWVFQDRLLEHEQRARMEEVVWILTDCSANAHLFRYEKGVWGDRFLEKLDSEPDRKWWAWKVGGDLLSELESSGKMVGGTFIRGEADWDIQVSSIKRDRARRQQYYLKAIEQLQGESLDQAVKNDALAQLYLSLADTFRIQSGTNLMKLTSFTRLPAIDDGRDIDDANVDFWLQNGASDRDDGDDRPRAAVLDASNQWQLPECPKEFEAARSDNERLLWLWNEAEKLSPKLQKKIKTDRGRFWWYLLGVDNISGAGYIYIEGGNDREGVSEPGALDLPSLHDNETIVLGTDGMMRKSIPERCGYIKMLREVVETSSGEDLSQAMDYLQQILSDRQQYDALEKLAKSVLAKPKLEASTKKEMLSILKAIGPMGKFENVPMFVVNSDIQVFYHTRQISRQRFELWKFDSEKALESTSEIDWSFLKKLLFQSGAIHCDQKEILTEYPDLRPYFQQVKSWEVAIAMKGNHMQTRTRINVPIDGRGDYLLVATLPDYQLLQPIHVKASVILSSPLESRELDDSGSRGDLFVIDAITGKPVVGAEVEAVAVPNNWKEDHGHGVTDHIGYLTGVNTSGAYMISRKGMAPELHLILPDWTGLYDFDSEVKSFLITNQPLYRPGQTVDFSGWLKRIAWNAPRPKQLPVGSRVDVIVTDAIGQTVYQKELPLDGFGGFRGSFQLGNEIVLGEYKVRLRYADRDRFSTDDPFDSESKTVKHWESVTKTWTIKVGEFRKPDFKVEMESDIADGKVVARVHAHYLSGEPIVGGKVTAYLRAAPFRLNLFPPAEWDDLYDVGYEWALPDLKWLRERDAWLITPSYQNHWDEEADMMDGFYESHQIERVVTGVTDAKGVARLTFSKKLPLIESFAYDTTVHVEVQEFTGRTVGARNSFTHSIHPFEVFVMPEKGFYRSGEKVKVVVHTMNAQGKPREGQGKFRVEKWEIAREGQAKLQDRTTIYQQNFQTGGDGRMTVEFTPPGPGQYRCVIDGGGTERGFVLEVIENGNSYGYYDGVQLIPDRSVCKKGELVEVLIQTQKKEAVVWLFEIWPNGLRRTPRLIQTKNHTALVRYPIGVSATPGIQIHAATFVDGHLKKASCKMVVPPVESRLDVQMAAEKPSLKPSEHAKISIDVKNASAQPVVSSLAVTAYDESLELLSSSLPRTSALYPDLFDLYLYGQMNSSLDSDSRNRYAFLDLYYPGCFWDREELVGEVKRNRTARFEKAGVHLWVAYFPPELPNSVGASGGGGSIFPVTPASPNTYSSLRTPSALPTHFNKGDAARVDAVLLRNRFSDRAYWGAPILTDRNGHAEVKFDLPENLTSWKVQAWAFGKGVTFGDASLTLTSSKPLQLRPLTPRAGVVGDVMDLGVQVQNGSASDHSFQVSIEVDDGMLLDGAQQKIHLAAGQQGQVRWRVKFNRVGSAVMKFRCRSQDGRLSDGTEIRIPVAAMRVPVTVSAQGEMASSEESTHYSLKLAEKDHLRSEWKKGKLKVRVDAAPVAGALMVLPDLLNYPYGCTEQTLNRFLPAMIAWKSASSLGIDWASLQQTIVNDRHPQAWVSGRSQYKISEKPANLSEKKVKAMIYTGLNRLKDLQSNHGWWGWYSPADRSHHIYLTALAVRGIEMARAAGFSLKNHPMTNGADWLEDWAEKRVMSLRKMKTKPTAEDAFVLYVLMEAGKKETAKLREVLLENRQHLPLSGLIHLALSVDQKSAPQKFAELMLQLEQKVEILDHRAKRGGQSGQWWQDSTELRAWYLKLLVKSKADQSKVRKQVFALLALRRDGIHWKSTRDSALCVEVLMEAAIYDGTLIPTGKNDIEVMVTVEGVTLPVTLKKKNFWSADVTVPLPLDQIENDVISIHLARHGDALVSSSASLLYESAQAKHMQSTAHGIEVERQYFRVDHQQNRQRINKGDVLKSGDLIEVVLKMMASDATRFVHLRDPIPAGFEPVVQSSGYQSGAYRECRTGETHIFISELTPWNRTQRYWLRAVTPGVAYALPACAECMYAPEVFGQGEIRELKIEN